MASEKFNIDVLINTASSAKSVGELRSALKGLNDAQKDVATGSVEFNKLSKSIDSTKNSMLDAAIGAAKSATSIRELSLSLKDLKSMQEGLDKGSPAFNQLSEAINETDDRVGNLNDSFNTLTGSGVERLTKSASLLKEGFFNLDMDKMKSGLKGVTSGFSALGKALLGNPILLIGAVIIAVGVALWELKDKIKPITILFEAIGKVIDALIEKLKEFSDWIGITDFEGDEMNKKAEDRARKEIERNKRVKKLADEMIAENKKNAEEKKKRDDDAEKEDKRRLDERLKANDVLNKKIEDQKNASIKNDEERALARTKLDNDRAINEINNSKASSKVKNEALLQQEITYLQEVDKVKAEFKAIEDKRVEESNAKIKEIEDKKKADKITTIESDDALAQAKFEGDIIKLGENELAILEVKKQALQSEHDAKIATAALTGESTALIEQEFANSSLLLEQETSEKKKQLAEEEAAAKLAATEKGLNAAKSLTDSFFTLAQLAAGNDAKKQLELKKKMFAVDKAFAITRAVMDGVRGVQAALTLPPPASFVMAGITAIAAAANIAKIASSKFDGGGSGGGTSVSAPAAASSPSISSGSAATPTATTPSNFKAGQFYELGKGTPESQSGTQRVIVVESDISRVQSDISRIQVRSTQRLGA